MARKQHISLLFALYLAVLAAWIVFRASSLAGTVGFLDTQPAERWGYYGLVLLSVLLFHLNSSVLFASFPARVWWLYGALWLAVFAVLENNLLVLPTLPASGNGFAYSRQSLVRVVLLAGWWLFMVGTVFVAGHVYRRTTRPFQQRRYINWAVFLGSSILGLGLIFFLPLHPAFEVSSFVLLSLGSVFGLWTAGAYLRTRGIASPYRVVRAYGSNISGIHDPDRLLAAVGDLLKEALLIQRVVLFLVGAENSDSGEAAFRIESPNSSGEGTKTSLILDAGSPLSSCFRQERRILTRYDLHHQPGMKDLPSAEMEWLAKLDAELFIPIFNKEEWDGLLVLGPKLSGIPYTADDLDLLSLLADQTAIALKNARLVESLTRLNNDFRRAYAALERANNHMERLDRTKSDFISVVSHELRTPLSVIRGYSEMLRDEASFKQNSYYMKLLTGIHSGILRLHEVVDSMLDMAEIDTRSLELHTEPVGLHMLLRMVCEGYKKDFQDRKIQLKIEDLRTLPNIEADSEALRKVFNHLVANAIKYTPDGGCVTINGRFLPSSTVQMPEGAVQVTVTDTGIGVERDLHELIFAKFYQTTRLDLHSTGKSKYKGAGPGLGLSIAKGIVEAHGGKIYVESPGRDEEKFPGSSFHVILPLKR